MPITYSSVSVRGLTVLNVVLLASLFGGCSADLIDPQPSGEPALAVETSAGQVVLRDLPELTVALPDPSSEPALYRDSLALRRQVAANGGEVFVGLKPAGAPRTKETERLETSIERPGLLVRRGTRAALSIADVQTALSAITSMQGEIVRYYEAVGIAMVRIPAERVVGMSRHASVNWVEPRLDVMRPDDANALGERRAAMFTQTIPANITHIAAPEAWTYSTGVGARVLFIDKGYDRGHEDLPVVPLGNCSNGSRNGCDDDPVFNQNHGTAVAGVTFARNNTFGVVGVAHGVSASDAYFWGACDTSCYDQDINGGLNWAISSLGSLGIINMSLSGNIWQQAIADCVSAANAAGHVQVASAGNSGITEIRYPAGYPDVFGVGGVKPDDVHHPVSTTGTQVDFVAPYTVYTTSPGNTDPASI